MTTDISVASQARKPARVRKGIRWTSTPLSADRGEISVLAIVETLIANGISLWIAWQLQTLLHIAVSASLAPLLLLRTKRSTTFALARYLTIISSAPTGRAAEIIFLFIWVISLPFVSIFLKIYSTVRSLFLRPLISIEAIPYNWRRAVLCVDTIYPPEILPGAERLCKRSKFRDFPTLRRYADAFRDNLGFTDLLFLASAGLFVGFTLFASIVYRFSLKSTALIWSPLLWVVWDARGSGVARVDLKHILDRPLYKVMRAYSALIAILFAVKIALLFKIQAVVEALNDALESKGIYLYVAPHMLPSWQLAAVINALLAWLLYLFAEKQLAAREIGDPTAFSDGNVRSILATTSVVRNLLAGWAIACTLYIAWHLAWPGFCVKWLPSSMMTECPVVAQ
jgi:hypothetical protein